MWWPPISRKKFCSVSRLFTSPVLPRPKRDPSLAFTRGINSELLEDTPFALRWGVKLDWNGSPAAAVGTTEERRLCLRPAIAWVISVWKVTSSCSWKYSSIFSSSPFNLNSTFSFFPKKSSGHFLRISSSETSLSKPTQYCSSVSRIWSICGISCNMDLKLLELSLTSNSKNNEVFKLDTQVCLKEAKEWTVLKMSFFVFYDFAISSQPAKVLMISCCRSSYPISRYLNLEFRGRCILCPINRKILLALSVSLIESLQS